jgi:hypothetical protein
VPSADYPFATGGDRRAVLAVARSVPAAGRLLDVVPLLDPDSVSVTFTVPPGSVSQTGVLPLLHEAGVTRLLPWRQALRGRFALALAASPKGGLHRLRAPLLMLPHGVGHNRLVGAAPGDLDVASGLAPEQLVHRTWYGRRRVVPARIALSHSEQLDRLRCSCPPAADRARVVGDPAFDRMLANSGRRDRYRSTLGADAGRRLVVLSSTWNRRTLLGAQRDLVRRLLAELPVDEYRVLLVAHPNIWAREGGARLGLWFADELEAGLGIVPPSEGWRTALIASDLVVGDHGSVTFYAAALPPCAARRLRPRRTGSGLPTTRLPRPHPRPRSRTAAAAAGGADHRPRRRAGAGRADDRTARELGRAAAPDDVRAAGHAATRYPRAVPSAARPTAVARGSDRLARCVARWFALSNNERPLARHVLADRIKEVDQVRSGRDETREADIWIINLRQLTIG